MTPTPGPWTVGEHRGVWVGPVVKAGRTGVAFIVGEHEANAHLIAAAPDLLTALKTLVFYLEDGEAEPGSALAVELFAAKAAITKALRRKE